MLDRLGNLWLDRKIASDSREEATAQAYLEREVLLTRATAVGLDREALREFLNQLGRFALKLVLLFLKAYLAKKGV